MGYPVQLIRLMGLTILGLFLFSPPALNAATGDTKEATAAKKVVEEYFKALNGGQLEVIVGLYHPDSVFLPKNAPAVRGISEITKAYRILFEKARLDTEHVYHHVSVYGNIAIVESQGSGTLTLLENKKIVPSNNKELFVLRKIGKKWKIDWYMFNDSEKQGA